MIFPKLNTLNGTIFIGLLVSIITACGDGYSSSSTPLATPTPSSYSYSQPMERMDGWSIDSLANHQIDVAKIETLVRAIEDNVDIVNFDSISIVRNGVLLLDENFKTELDWPDTNYGNHQLSMHSMQSVTKSFTSALVGIAIDQGYLSLNDRFFDYFGEYANIDNWSDAKNSITVEDVLTMRHGLQWDEWTYPYGDARNTQTYTQSFADPVLAVLGLPMATEPGTTFAYSTGITDCLGQMLVNATGQSIEAFAAENLFSPLGITNVLWHKTKTGHAATGYGLFLEPRSMAKFGQLFLDNGMWEGQQLLSPEWVQQTSIQQLPFPTTNPVYLEILNIGYSLHWWIEDFKMQDDRIMHTFSAEGNGGQFIFVIPELDMVVVLTGNNYTWEEDSVYGQAFTMMHDYILPAINLMH